MRFIFWVACTRVDINITPVAQETTDFHLLRSWHNSIASATGISGNYDIFVDVWRLYNYQHMSKKTWHRLYHKALTIFYPVIVLIGNNFLCCLFILGCNSLKNQIRKIILKYAIYIFSLFFTFRTHFKSHIHASQPICILRDTSSCGWR